ncbi:hypothetical protein [Planomonospora sp. ID82291]|uniref:hypothetical protein n=1 Tax=Planomonospora sp. ID82291 TaxID=2738136 RepID=UPI0018C3AA49|nr:hypothetical protein [Planomonospora sp. ID82291]MBG0817568.1 hypothetical protein [Planomonospora sp. ID82291]
MTRVIIAAGHMIDAPGRPAARFPPSRIPWVTEEIRAAFDAWAVGPDTTVICGGARGADVIAAEEGHARGARVLLCLALPVEEFRRRSVDLPGTGWGERFRRLLRVAEVLPPPDGTGRAGGEEACGGVFALTNARMVALARRMDARPRVLLVWNGQDGDGPGGTSDLVRRLGYPADDPRVRVIDPTPPEPERR